MEPMYIEDLVKYAQSHGFNTGRFLTITSKGIGEFKFLDAYFGFVIPIIDGKEGDGFITTDALREHFGRDAKYLPTIGYDE